MSEGQAVPVQKIVDRLAEDCFEAHRGAFWWGEEARIAVAFGNDGHGEDRRSQLEVEAVRRLLAEYGGQELGFAVDADNYSWALACRLPDALSPDMLEGALWMAWNHLSELGREGRELKLDEEAVRQRMVLDWDAIQAAFAVGKFPSFTGLQGNIARAALERNGLLF